MIDILQTLMAQDYEKKGRIVPFNPLIKDPPPDEEAMQFAIDQSTKQFRGLLFDNVRGSVKEMIDGIIGKIDAEYGTEFKNHQFSYEDYDDFLELMLDEKDLEENEQGDLENPVPEIVQ
jgi:hypothetical protein